MHLTWIVRGFCCYVLLKHIWQANSMCFPRDSVHGVWIKMICFNLCIFHSEMYHEPITCWCDSTIYEIFIYITRNNTAQTTNPIATASEKTHWRLQKFYGFQTDILKSCVIRPLESWNILERYQPHLHTWLNAALCFKLNEFSWFLCFDF